jgi:hypothetical protein
MLNEFRKVAEVGKVIRVKRDSSGLSGDAARHESEVQMQDPETDRFVYRTIENNGTLDELLSMVEQTVIPITVWEQAWPSGGPRIRAEFPVELLSKASRRFRARMGNKIKLFSPSLSDISCGHHPIQTSIVLHSENDAEEAVSVYNEFLDENGYEKEPPPKRPEDRFCGVSGYGWPRKFVLCLNDKEELMKHLKSLAPELLREDAG